jgi:hypothetical protein
LFIILSYVLFKDLRTYGRRMLSILSAFDLLTALSYGMPERASAALCEFQAAAINLTTLLALGWTNCVAFHIFITVRGDLAGARFERLLLALVGSVAVTMTGLMFSAQTGWADLWCWVPDAPGAARIYRVAYYSFVWGSWLLNLAFYIAIRLHVRSLLKLGGTYPKHIAVLRSVMYIPLILIIIRLPGSLHRILQIAGARADNERVLDGLQAVGDPGQGFADALMFGALNAPVRRRFIALFRRCRRIGCARPQDATSEISFDASDAPPQLQQQLLSGDALPTPPSPSPSPTASTAGHTQQPRPPNSPLERDEEVEEALRYAEAAGSWRRGPRAELTQQASPW